MINYKEDDKSLKVDSRVGRRGKVRGTHDVPLSLNNETYLLRK